MYSDHDDDLQDFHGYQVSQNASKRRRINRNDPLRGSSSSQLRGVTHEEQEVDTRYGRLTVPVEVPLFRVEDPVQGEAQRSTDVPAHEGLPVDEDYLMYDDNYTAIGDEGQKNKVGADYGVTERF